MDTHFLFARAFFDVRANRHDSEKIYACPTSFAAQIHLLKFIGSLCLPVAQCSLRVRLFCLS